MVSKKNNLPGSYFVRLFRMYSAAVVLSGNGFEGISLTPLTTLVTFFIGLVHRGIPGDTMFCLNI
jgi:hypothetical protein